MASSQNSKEATRRPVTWEHGAFTFLQNRWEREGRRRQIPVKTLALSKMCFFCFPLHPFAFLTDGSHVLSPLPNLLMPPFIHFPSAATDTTNMAALMGGHWWALGRPPSGNFQGLQFSIPASPPDPLFGTGAKVESQRMVGWESVSQRADAGDCLFHKTPEQRFLDLTAHEIIF